MALEKENAQKKKKKKKKIRLLAKGDNRTFLFSRNFLP